MKKFLIRESFTLTGTNVRKELLTERDKKFIDSGGIILSGVMQRADAMNGNGRIYPRALLEREIKNYQILIQENRAYGELDHPIYPEVKLENVSHRVIEIGWSGNEVVGKIKVAPSPTKGAVAKAIIDDGGVISISSRGLGSITKQGEKTIVNDDFQLICFDLVTEPSTDGAHMMREMKEFEVADYTNFQVQSSQIPKLHRLYSLFDDILL